MKSEERVVTSKPPADVASILSSFMAQVSQNEPDEHGLSDVFWGAFAQSLATSVHAGFRAKSAHGTDELGDKWKDHSPKTKAYSRPDARKGLSLPGPKHRPTLTKEQDKIWRIIFIKRLAYLRTQMDEGDAHREAAKSAWNYVKARLGAETLLNLTRDKMLLLLQKSGALAESLSPGNFSGEKYDPPPNQVFRRERAGLTWGTSIEYAKRVGKDRPLWPKNIDVWINRGIDAGISAVVEKIKDILE